ncbi:MAG: stage II sporulation protein R [Eubacteriales bacterium]|nr:stage II sporulation protein R [Eubacteriales bacterium]
MKLFMKILVSTIVVAVMFSVVPFQSTCKELENDVLRLHIIANSDTEEDQDLKLKVRDSVLTAVSKLYDDVTTKEEAKEITQNNLPLVIDTAQDVVKKYSKDYEVEARVTNKFFDTRYYDEFTMPAGMYDTLEIKIGEAKGKNWWCVMFPTLCVGASSKESMQEDLSSDEYEVITGDDYVFKFKIVEFFEKICSYFR